VVLVVVVLARIMGVVALEQTLELPLLSGTSLTGMQGLMASLAELILAVGAEEQVAPLQISMEVLV
jgi:hypothetical protein